MFVMHPTIRSSPGVCNRMPGMHRPIPPVFNSVFFQIFPLTDSLKSFTQSTDSRHTNAVKEVKPLVSEPDYPRTTCIIRFSGSDFHGSDEVDTRIYPFTAPTHCSGQ